MTRVRSETKIDRVGWHILSTDSGSGWQTGNGKPYYMSRCWQGTKIYPKRGQGRMPSKPKPEWPEVKPNTRIRLCGYGMHAAPSVRAARSYKQDWNGMLTFVLVEDVKEKDRTKFVGAKRTILWGVRWPDVVTLARERQVRVTSKALEQLLIDLAQKEGLPTTLEEAYTVLGRGSRD